MWVGGICVGLSASPYGVGIEGIGVAWDERCSCGYKNVVEAAVEFAACAHLDAEGIDSFLVHEILLNVEVALRGRVGRFIRGVSADNNEFGSCVAIEGESDLIETSLSFVVDTDRTLSVAFEGDAAEIARRRCDRRWRSRDRDRCVGGGLLAEVIDDIAGYGDGAWVDARSDERGGWGIARDLACGG